MSSGVCKGGDKAPKEKENKMTTPTHAGTLLPYENYYKRVSAWMDRKTFRVALKTSGCCYVIRDRVYLDEEMFQRFQEKMRAS
jgi:hypothetical protein